MKKINKLIVITIIMIITFFNLLLNQLCASEWQAEIHADKADNHPFVTIGVKQIAEKVSNAPESPTYKCFLYLYDADQPSEFFKTDIRQSGVIPHHWILAINPHGNETGPGLESATISWDIDDLGPGNFSLLEGLDMNGNYIVPDMKKQSSFISYAEKNKYLHYAIINSPGLSDLVGTLRMLAGFSSEQVFELDIDQDGQTELSDAVCMIRYLAQQ